MHELHGLSHCANTASQELCSVQYSAAKELIRIEKAIANKEDARIVAEEMGRTYRSVSKKLDYLQRVAGLQQGKFTVEENERVKQALENNEDYKEVAKELCRDPRTVQTRMLSIKCNPRQQQCKKKKVYSVEEDLLILEKVIPHLKVQKLSDSGIISQSDSLELATELQRNVGGFISKSTGKKCEDKKASRRSEEVKNQVDPLSKFNICWVKIQLFSQSWESFQT